MGATKIKILILDSDKDCLVQLQMQIAAFFPEVTVVTSGEGADGLRLAISEKPDILLLDIALSDTDALELCRQMKKTDELSHIPVLALVPENTAKDRRQQALDAGAEGFLGKPVDETELTAQIRTMIRIRTAQTKERKNKLLQDMMDNSSSLIFMTDLEGRLIGVNRKLAQLYNSTPEAIIGQKRQAFMPQEIAAQHFANDLSVVKGGHTASFEEDNIEADGHHLYFTEKFPLYDDTGKLYGIAGISTDITDRKRMEETLRREKALIAAIFDSTPGLLYLYNEEGKLIRWNKKHVTLTGYSDDELSGMTIMDWYKDDPISQKGVADGIKRAITTGFGDVYANLQKKDGSTIPMYFTASPLSVNGTSYFTGVGIDMTEIRENEDKFRTLLEFAPDAFFQGDVKGNFIMVNDKAIELTGYSREELLTMNMSDLFPPDVIRVDPLRYDLLNKGATLKRERTLRKKSGEEILVEMNSKAMPDGTYQSFSRDITDRIKAEEAVRNSEARLKRAELASKSGNWELHIDTRQMNASEGAAELYGVDQDRFDYDFIKSIPLPEYRPMLDETLLALINENKPYDIEFRIRTIDSGELRDIHSTAVYDKDKKVLFGIIQDITDRKKAEAEKAKLQDQLVQAQKMESVGRLAGGVAHDYNNMLSVIIGYTELALEEVSETDRVHGDLKEILAAAKRSADITRQLLAFARKQTIAPEILDLNETVDGMLKMLRWLIGEDITLNWMPGHEKTLIKVDPSQVDQILANLCVNARDAIAGVGTITIETGITAFAEEDCAGDEGPSPGEYVLLSVSDDGCGMNREVIDKLFEPFFTTKEVGQGTGLGLATVYGIVRQNNGFIRVYSEPGNGSTFRIYLPRHLGAYPGFPPAGFSGLPPSRGEMILLVEDERALLNMGKTMLEKLGYRVLTAERASGAIRLAESHDGEIALLMTDIVMPEMNGRDLADRLQTLYPKVKRLFMSGYTAKAIAHRGILEDGLHFIQKPFSLKDLACKVRETLDSE